MHVIELLLELKNIKEMKKILITGKVLSDKDSLAKLANKYGAKHVLYKPFQKEELVSAVENSLK